MIDATWTATRLRDYVLSQYAPERAPRLAALIDGVLGLVDRELYAPLRASVAARSSDTATGLWLDRIGERLGFPRPSTAQSGPRFGFPGGPQAQPFDTAPFAGLQFNREPVTDGVYRALLRIRGRVLRGSGSRPELVAAVAAGLPGVTWTTEDGRYLAFTVRSEQAFLARVAVESRAIPSPAGTLVAWRSERTNRFDSLAALQVVAPSLRVGDDGGRWYFTAGRQGRVGDDGVIGTGPGPSSPAGYPLTAAYDAGGTNDNGAVLFDPAAWPGTLRRRLTLTLSVAGWWGNDAAEGVAVQGRVGNNAWQQIAFVNGWRYYNYQVGTPLNVYFGPARATALAGGWAVVEVDVPDQYTDVRLYPQLDPPGGRRQSIALYRAAFRGDQEVESW